MSLKMAKTGHEQNCFTVMQRPVREPASHETHLAAGQGDTHGTQRLSCAGHKGVKGLRAAALLPVQYGCSSFQQAPDLTADVYVQHADAIA